MTDVRRPYTTNEAGIPPAVTSIPRASPRAGRGAKARLASNIADHLKQDVVEPVLGQALEYSRRVDGDLGAIVAKQLNGARRVGA